MSAAVAILVVLSALAHAAWNAILKRTKDPEHSVVGVMTMAALTAALVCLVAGSPMPSRASVFWGVAAGLLEAGYFVTLARALVRAPLGPVYTTVRGGALVIVWPASVLLLGEELTLSRGLGSALVILGLAATGMGQREPTRLRAAAGSGLGYAAFCAVFVAGYHLAYKLALSSGGDAGAIVAISLATASVVNLSRLGRDKRRLVIAVVRAEPLRIVLAGVLAALGFAVFLVAMGRAGAGLVLTLRNTSILFAQVFGLFMGEKLRRAGVAGAVLVTVGSILLAR